MKRRVVVTGLGALTPLGNSLNETWEAAVAGTSGVGPITKFDSSAYKTRIAAEVKNFDPLQYVSKQEVRRYDDFILYALAAAEMALADAQLVVGSEFAERTGVIIGSAIGGLATLEEEYQNLLNAGPRKISPFAVPAILANLASGHVSIRFGAKGPINCAVTACAAGTSAIGDAYKTIAHGDADVMITGGTEAAVTQLAVGGFGSMRALSVRNEEPQRASRPFDKDRDGFIIGEGCGIMILEELSFALNRRRAYLRGACRLRMHIRCIPYGRSAPRP